MLIRNAVIMYIILLLVLSFWKPEMIRETGCSLPVAVVILSVSVYYIMAIIDIYLFR